jgi:hypothetical protein
VPVRRDHECRFALRVQTGSEGVLEDGECHALPNGPRVVDERITHFKDECWSRGWQGKQLL